MHFNRSYTYDLRVDIQVLISPQIYSYVNDIYVQVVFYKRLSKVFFTDKIPKAPSGKILRKDLRARLAADLPN